MKLARIFSAYATVLMIAAAGIAFSPVPLRAQDAGGAMGSGGQGMSMSPSMPSNDSSSPADDPSMAPPMSRMHITQEITGSMLAAPPYGLAPMKVGFFVIANDPEGQGFLTYSWNFGDGTVSSLPPELYIFHNYQNPGNYVCTLTVTTVDGRSQTFIQGVLAKPPGD